MSEPQRPLLLLPSPGASDREKRNSGRSPINIPSAQRQAERLTPKFGALTAAFEARRIQMQAATPTDDPELIIVFETVGAVEDFIKAVQKIQGLEWLLDTDETGIAADDDFFDLKDQNKELTGRVYLLGSNKEALVEILSLWNRYKTDPEAKMAFGLNKWKDVFKHLRDIRFWGVKDRIGPDVRDYLKNRLECGDNTIRFEIEAWCHTSSDKNNRTVDELSRLVKDIGGQLLHSALLQDIA
jgi:hypothetical protein